MRVENIENIKVSDNNVIVKLPDTYKMMLNNEVNIRGLSVKTQYEPSYYAPRYGTVIAIPDKLTFGVGAMVWKTDIEIRVGDTVWFNYLVCLMALGRLLNPHTPNPETKYFVCGEDIYVVLPYESLIVAKRGEDIVCLNGYCIGKQIQEKQSEKLITENKKTGWVELRYIGTPVTEYLNDTVDVEDVCVGDVVCINKILAEKMENGMTNTFSDDELVFFQRKQIYGKKD